MNDATPIWTPDANRISDLALTAFAQAASVKTNKKFPDYAALHAWSIADREEFWGLVWDFCGIVGEKGDRVLVDGENMLGAAFFPDARLNFAANLLKKTGKDEALVFWGEDKVKRRVSWDELRELTSRLQQFFVSSGVKKGDRIAAMMPNMPETVACMLAAASIGAIWSSCSPDFGLNAAVDRFGQIEPVLFIVSDGYWYGGKSFDIAEKTVKLATAIPSVRKVLVVDYLGTAIVTTGLINNAVELSDALASFDPAPLSFENLPFDHPLAILFSSGTTGAPKCIIHSAGGTLIQHLKEHRLHADLREGDRLFYFTTCGWMMWNWLISGLASGATLLLYDGSPFHPDGNILFDYAERESMTHVGVSAKFIDSVRKAGLRPVQSHSLKSVRTLFSTGSPLSPDDFTFVYESIHPDVHLASISGGTDIVSCFVLGIPSEPVWIGEIQGPGLGMAMDILDEEGKPQQVAKGELVCTKAFPSMPVSFWNDPEGNKFHDAYFARFDNIWCHGDYAQWTSHGGIIIHGRSDATLNPGGVRIGTAEIYNQVEQMPEILEALAVGQDFENDVRVLLFVRLAPGNTLNEELQMRIKSRIRSGASPRHVPAKIIAVADIPRTKSGKITELAVREIIHGRPVKNSDALANPESLELYKDVSALGLL